MDQIARLHATNKEFYPSTTIINTTSKMIVDLENDHKLTLIITSFVVALIALIVGILIGYHIIPTIPSLI